MKRIVLILFALSVVGGAQATAGKHRGKQVKYVNVHPIPKEYGGGVCHIEVPHVHVYAPVDAKVQYRVVDDNYYFVGDPVAYGWDGPKYTYEGHHPVPVGEVVYDHRDHDDVVYCYLDGPHFHYYTPPPSLQFEVKGDAYWYVGDFPTAYVEARAELDPIDVVYEPIHYERPVVVVDPPVAWVGLRFGNHWHGHGHAHGVVEGDVAIVAPALEVEVAVPTIVIGGGVIVTDHHHDNGRHRGWYKGKGGRGKWHGGKRGKGKWKW